MGAIDQSDVKVHVIKLSKEGFPNWHVKQLAVLIKNSIGNAHANFCLDPKTTQKEFFTEFYNKLIAELLELSPDYQTYSSFESAKKRKRPDDEDEKGSEKKTRSHKKKMPKARKYQSTKGLATVAGLRCCGRTNLQAYLRFTPGPASSGTRPSRRRVICAFCGYRSTMYTCRGCEQTFCMTPPTHLQNPVTGFKFRADGPFCWHRVHGFSTWASFEK